MPISFVAAASGENNGGSTTVSVSVPTHLEGDLLVAVLVASDEDTTLPRTPSGPAGWTLHASHDQDVANPVATRPDSSVWTKRAEAGEPASYTWTFPHSNKHVGLMGSYRGVNQVHDTGPDTNFDCGLFTDIPVPNCWHVGGGAGASTGSYSLGAGATNRLEVESSGGGPGTGKLTAYLGDEIEANQDDQVLERGFGGSSTADSPYSSASVLLVPTDLYGTTQAGLLSLQEVLSEPIPPIPISVRFGTQPERTVEIWRVNNADITGRGDWIVSQYMDMTIGSNFDEYFWTLLSGYSTGIVTRWRNFSNAAQDSIYVNGDTPLNNTTSLAGGYGNSIGDRVSIAFEPGAGSTLEASYCRAFGNFASDDTTRIGPNNFEDFFPNSLTSVHELSPDGYAGWKVTNGQPNPDVPYYMWHDHCFTGWTNWVEGSNTDLAHFLHMARTSRTRAILLGTISGSTGWADIVFISNINMSFPNSHTESTPAPVAKPVDLPDHPAGSNVHLQYLYPHSDSVVFSGVNWVENTPFADMLVIKADTVAESAEISYVPFGLGSIVVYTAFVDINGDGSGDYLVVYFYDKMYYVRKIFCDTNGKITVGPEAPLIEAKRELIEWNWYYDGTQESRAPTEGSSVPRRLDEWTHPIAWWNSPPPIDSWTSYSESAQYWETSIERGRRSLGSHLPMAFYLNPDQSTSERDSYVYSFPVADVLDYLHIHEGATHGGVRPTSSLNIAARSTVEVIVHEQEDSLTLRLDGEAGPAPAPESFRIPIDAPVGALAMLIFKDVWSLRINFNSQGTALAIHSASGKAWEYLPVGHWSQSRFFGHSSCYFTFIDEDDLGELVYIDSFNAQDPHDPVVGSLLIVTGIDEERPFASFTKKYRSDNYSTASGTRWDSPIWHSLSHPFGVSRGGYGFVADPTNSAIVYDNVDAMYPYACSKSVHGGRVDLTLVMHNYETDRRNIQGWNPHISTPRTISNLPPVEERPSIVGGAIIEVFSTTEVVHPSNHATTPFHIYDDKKTVPTVLSLVMNPRRVAGRSIGLAWNDRKLVSKPEVLDTEARATGQVVDGDTSYGGVAFHHVPELLKWRVSQSPRKDLEAIWDVGAPVGRDLSLDWDTDGDLQAVNKNLEFLYDIAGPIGKSIEVEWDVFLNANKDSSFVWGVGAAVGSEFATGWGVGGPAVADMTLRFGVLRSVFDSLTIRSGQLGFISDDLALDWNILITEDRNLALPGAGSSGEKPFNPDAAERLNKEDLKRVT